jgi:ribosome maturation factor RimP
VPVLDGVGRGHTRRFGVRPFLIKAPERGIILVFQESCVGRILPAPFFLPKSLSFETNKRFEQCKKERSKKSKAAKERMSLDLTVERTVNGLGYDLVETERAPRGLLRIYIDRVAGDPNGEFITVDDCEKVTRQLQHVLEVESFAYERLEVSSPGLDRLIHKSADFQRFVGHEVDVTLKLPFQGRKKYRGLLQVLEGVATAVDPASAPAAWRLVFSEGKVEQALDFALQEVKEARLVPVVDFKGRRFAPAEGGDVSDGLNSNPAQERVDGGDKK